MKLSILVLCLLFTVLYGQHAGPQEPGPPRLPNGKTQTEEILKAEFEKSLKDAGDLVKLSEELKIELEKNDRHVLSLGAIKKTEEIEKIARRIRGRMKRI